MYYDLLSRGYIKFLEPLAPPLVPQVTHLQSATVLPPLWATHYDSGEPLTRIALCCFGSIRSTVVIITVLSPQDTHLQSATVLPPLWVTTVLAGEKRSCPGRASPFLQPERTQGDIIYL